jgi:hypothetical protein
MVMSNAGLGILSFRWMLGSSHSLAILKTKVMLRE